MKVSNETKVGALTAVAIAVLILGFNYLKGKNITERSNTIYAVFPSVDGLALSNSVFINGYQVGRVSDLEAKDRNVSGIIVSINLSKGYNIPKDSYAVIDKPPLGTTSIKIKLGKSSDYVQDGDTLGIAVAPSILGEIDKRLDPTLNKVEETLTSLNAVIMKLNDIIDPTVKNNLQSVIANLSTSSQSLTRLLNDQTGALAKSLNHVESITGNLEKNNGRIDSTLANVQRLTAKVNDVKIGEAVDGLRNSLKQLEATITKANSPNSSIGALLNDRKLYDEIRQTNRSLTTLLDDFKTHPKRYVNVSVFGKKDKSTPLAKPIYDSTANQ